MPRPALSRSTPVGPLSAYARMLAGEDYAPADPELKERRLRARSLAAKLNRTKPAKHRKRRKLIIRLLGSVGENVVIHSLFNCDYGINIHVGENFYANSGCVILDAAEVRIGDNCLLGPQVGIYTAQHPLDPRLRRKGTESARPVIIGNDCWIGGHATILPGVHLGNNVIVAAGAVVTRSFGDDVIIGGNPARIIRTIAESSYERDR